MFRVVDCDALPCYAHHIKVETWICYQDVTCSNCGMSPTNREEAIHWLRHYAPYDTLTPNTGRHSLPFSVCCSIPCIEAHASYVKALHERKERELTCLKKVKRNLGKLRSALKKQSAVDRHAALQSLREESEPQINSPT